MNHQKNDVVSVGNTIRPSVIIMLAALGAMSAANRGAQGYTLTDARDRRSRALSPAAQKIVDDARARKISNKLKTAALCRKAKT